MLMTDLEKATTLIQLAHDRGGGCYLTPEMVVALVRGGEGCSLRPPTTSLKTRTTNAPSAA
jgi:hypothetical protein